MKLRLLLLTLGIVLVALAMPLVALASGPGGGGRRVANGFRAQLARQGEAGWPRFLDREPCPGRDPLHGSHRLTMICTR